MKATRPLLKLGVTVLVGVIAAVWTPTFAEQPTDAEKLATLKQYAPEVWLAEGEEYFPSSVGWAFPFLTRVERNGKYWLYAKQELSDPGDGSLPVFRGNLESASLYGFWVSGKQGNVIDLVYFAYYPYNRGKELGGTVWGNHVGDWENMVVRLDSRLKPEAVFLSQHAGDQMLLWSAIEKNASGHPVVFAAKGSHGLYPRAGNHEYKSTPRLVDVTGKGTRWRTWERLKAFDFERKRGLGNSRWPRWMDTDYTIATTKNPGGTDPASGAIYRWGNGKNGCGGMFKIYEKASGECRLNDGPEGPIDKRDRWEKRADCSRVDSPLWRLDCRK